MSPQEFKLCRERLGLSQTALGAQLGVTKQTIINYERENGDGPSPMAALAISALDPGGRDGAAFERALDNFVISVVDTRDADAIVSALDNVEFEAARARVTPGNFGEVQFNARTIAFERLVSALGTGPIVHGSSNSSSTSIGTSPDGIYVIQFTGVIGSGVGMLVLKYGTIAGADFAGGIYDGFYRVNSNIIHGHVGVFAPPGVTTVTGMTAGPRGIKLEIPLSIPLDLGNGQAIAMKTPGGPINVSFRKLRSLE